MLILLRALSFPVEVFELLLAARAGRELPPAMASEARAAFEALAPADAALLLQKALKTSKH